MKRVKLTLAVGDYDHLRGLGSGNAEIQGVHLTVHHYEPSEIFHRQQYFSEWDISEMSLAQHSVRISRGINDLVGLPIFPSRMFRHSAIYIRRESSVKNPSDLEGAKIGIPEWAQTAVVYMRGILAEQYGLNLRNIDWYQGGVEEPGRIEHVPVDLDSHYRCTHIADKSLNQMLVEGSLDAIIAAMPPPSFRDNDGTVRLMDNTKPIEQDYYQATKIFPIMHLVVVKRDILDKHPWLAENIMSGFQCALTNSKERLKEVRQSMYPVPWLGEYVADLLTVLGSDIFSYGIEDNRPTLEAFIRYGIDQRLWGTDLKIESLFAPQSVAIFRR